MLSLKPPALIAITCICAGAQSNTRRLTFEVASVRENHANVFRSGPLTVSDPLIRLHGYTVYGLIMDAWNLRDFQISIAPDIPRGDIVDTTYDIVARAPGESTPKLESVRLMLQSLLEDRFHLRVHSEKKQMSVYALEIAKGGPKLTESSGDAPCTVQTRLARDGRNDDETLSHCPMERLADSLTNKIQRPVLEKTGLTGRYDIHFIAVPSFRTRAGADPADIDPITAVGQLGLKLTPRKADVDILAVDHIEKPTDN